MNDKEAVEMMNRCRHEIMNLRAHIDRLTPKAEAYDNIAAILRLLPQPSRSMGEDLLWALDRRIREIETIIERDAALAKTKED
jgi:hypothetical protein